MSLNSSRRASVESKMGHIYMGQQDKFFLATTLVTALVGAGLMVGGFILRFGNNFNGFLVTAKQDNDLLELGRLDMIFGLYCGATGVLILSFFVAAFATYKKNKFLLYCYCGLIALMIIVQLIDGLLAFQYSDSIKQLSNDENMYFSFLEMKGQITNTGSNLDNAQLPNNDNAKFWTNTQKLLNCCGVQGVSDWAPYDKSQPFLKSTNCVKTHYNVGCEKQMRDRISSDSEYFAVSSMAVVVVEIVASFMAGYRAYHIKYED